MHPLTTAPPLNSVPTIRNPYPEENKLRLAAQQLESGFLAEFLKSSGFGEVSQSFGGGAGEDHFASFLRQAQADALVKAGGIGLSEAIFQSLKDRQNGA